MIVIGKHEAAERADGQKTEEKIFHEVIKAEIDAAAEMEMSVTHSERRRRREECDGR